VRCPNFHALKALIPAFDNHPGTSANSIGLPRSSELSNFLALIAGGRRVVQPAGVNAPTLRALQQLWRPYPPSVFTTSSVTLPASFVTSGLCGRCCGRTNARSQQQSQPVEIKYASSYYDSPIYIKLLQKVQCALA